MTKNKGYKIDFTLGTVTMTKAFAHQAEIYGTNEYKLLKDLRNDFPHLNIITRTPPKRKHPNKLTYNNMLCFVRCQHNADILLKEFSQVCEVSKGKDGNAYHHTKKWFLENFPNYKEIPRFDDKGNMINDFTKKPESTNEIATLPKSA